MTTNTLHGIPVRRARTPRGGMDTSEYVMHEAVPGRGVCLVRTDTIPGEEATIGLFRDASLIATEVVTRDERRPDRFEPDVLTALELTAQWAPVYLAVRDAADSAWASQEVAGRTELPVSDALRENASLTAQSADALAALLAEVGDRIRQAPVLLRVFLARYEAHATIPRPDALDVPRVYFRWAREHSAYVVRRAYALGVSKMEIYSLTGEARTTIDRILSAA